MRLHDQLLVELRLRLRVDAAAALLGGDAGVADLADVRPVRRVAQDVIVRDLLFFGLVELLGELPIEILAIAPLLISCGDTPVEPAMAADVSAGEWRTWVIANGAAVRPPAPPSNASAELDEIIAIQQSVTPAENAMIQKWNTLPTTAWHNLALDLFGFYWILLPDVRLATPARSARCS